MELEEVVRGGDQPPFGERGGSSSPLELVDAPVVLGLCESAITKPKPMAKTPSRRGDSNPGPLHYEGRSQGAVKPDAVRVGAQVRQAVPAVVPQAWTLRTIACEVL